MIAIQTTERNGKVVAATLVSTDDEIMLITSGGCADPHARQGDSRNEPLHPGA